MELGFGGVFRLHLVHDVVDIVSLRGFAPERRESRACHSSSLRLSGRKTCLLGAYPSAGCVACK